MAFRFLHHVPPLALAALLAAALAVRAQDWPGFHGLEKQGFARSNTVPVTWSTNRNVVWKVAIPGEGHSSPIVYGESVYVTTAYPTPGFARLRSVLQSTSSVLALASLAAGTWLAWKRWRKSSGQGESSLSWIAGRIGSVVLLFIAAGSILWAQKALGVGFSDLLAWKLSSLVVLLCVGATALQHPPNSAGWRALGLLCILFSVCVWLSFPGWENLLRERSWPGATIALLLVTPGLVGLALILASFLWPHPKGAQTLEGRDAFGTTRWAFNAGCLLAAFLFFANATYLQRTKELVRAVVCVDVASGKARWAREGLPGPQRPLTRMNTPATPTPVTDGEHIVSWFDSAGVMCVSRDGRLLWTQRELVSAPKYGIVTSPLLCDGVVVFVCDVEEPNAREGLFASSVTALEVESGKTLWRKDRRGHKEFASYATPVLVSLSGTNVVCVRGWHEVRSYDLRTGKEMCAYPLELRANHLVASPVSDGQRLLLVGASGNVCLDVAKWAAGSNPVSWSGNGHGEVSATPVIADGLAYLVYENGLAACMEMDTGITLWEKRLRGRFFSSVVASGGQICFCSEAGKTTVAARSREFRLLGEGDLQERTYASLVPTGKRLLVRTVRHLYCIGE